MPAERRIRLLGLAQDDGESGAADVTVGGQSFAGLGGRATPFEDRAPGAVYIPAGADYTVAAASDLELAVCAAPGGGGHAARVIEAAGMSQETNVRAAEFAYANIRRVLVGEAPESVVLPE